MVPFIKVVAPPGTPKQYQETARRWAMHFDAARPEGATGYHAYTIPATISYPGYVVRHQGDQIYVHVNQVRTVRPVSETPTEPSPESRLLVHGLVRNIFLGRGASTSVYDPLGTPPYVETGVPQVTLPETAHIGSPVGWNIPNPSSKWSHVRGIRPTLYSGWMRAVVQSALGIGYGTPDGELGEDAEPYAKIEHRFAWPVSDGVLFIDPFSPYEPAPPYAQNLRPVAVRIDASRKRILIGDLDYWDAAYSSLGSGDGWPGDAEWEAYLEDINDADPLAALIVETFWGLPAGASLFDAPTTITGYGTGDMAQARKQRVNSGLFTELPLGYAAYGNPITTSHGWAFSYTELQAAHVVVSYDPATKWPRGTLVIATFEIKLGDEPPFPTIPTHVTQYMAHWVNEGTLDALAVTQWSRRLEQGVVDIYASIIPQTPSGDVTEGGLADPSAARQLSKETVDHPRFVASVRVVADVTGWIDNPVGGSLGVPKVHVKVPNYGQLFGNTTWRMDTPEGGETPPEDGFVPISCFYHRTGGMTVSQLFSSVREKVGTETFGEVPECAAQGYTQRTVRYSGETRYRDACLSTHQSLDDSQLEAEQTVSVDVVPQYERYIVGDDITDPGRGTGTKHKVFLQTTREYTRGLAPQQGSIAFPMYEREGVYLGYPAYGTRGTTQLVSYRGVAIQSPYRAYYERCFPGYGNRAPKYFECTAHQSCPTHTTLENYGYFPRVVLDPGGYYPDACAMWWPSGPWSAHCDDMDALYLGTKDLTLYVPPSENVSVPQNLLAEVYLAHSAAPGGILQTIEEQGFAAGVSPWWEEVAPNLTGLVPAIYASANAIGQPMLLADKDFGGETLRMTGPVGSEPFASARASSVFIGHAIPGETSGG